MFGRLWDKHHSVGAQMDEHDRALFVNGAVPVLWSDMSNVGGCSMHEGGCSMTGPCLSTAPCRSYGPI